ncbi:MAG TPA: S1/P1 nuclease [Candidatus Krumholzibacteria bacterium]|nr:S1/P1 nuclease [Candidatus Krumholzibacteria bacterium]
MSTTLYRRILVVTLVALLALPTVAYGWGSSVHRLINRAATEELPSSFQGFAQWADDLENLSTAADERKSYTSGESIKHYIDIDDYPEFFSGTLPHDYATMVATYGQSRVDNNGTVPWAILASYQALVADFQAEDWTSAVADAADLGHYIADSHQPLHVTKNYNGQLTDQYGIHSRFESTMTGYHLSELVPGPQTGAAVANPLEAVFDWIDVVYPGVQAILDADQLATDAAGGSTSGSTYYNTLWQEIGSDTMDWISEASLALASFWYTAWIEAGAPPLPGDATDAGSAPLLARTRLLANVPNPFNPSTRLRFELASAGPASLRIVNSAGRTVRRFELSYLDQGPHEVTWNGTGDSGAPLASGVYRVILIDGRGQHSSGSAVLVK